MPLFRNIEHMEVQLWAFVVLRSVFEIKKGLHAQMYSYTLVYLLQKVLKF